MIMGDEAREVGAVMERYVDAAYRGDTDALRECFDPAAVMFGYLGERLLAGGPQPFFDDIRTTPSMQSTGAPYVAETVSLEVVGDAASVRIDETGFFGTFSFSNWFHLIRRADGEWRIVSKLFAMRPSDVSSA
jgi:hypothetical protein